MNAPFRRIAVLGAILATTASSALLASNSPGAAASPTPAASGTPAPSSTPASSSTAAGVLVQTTRVFSPTITVPATVAPGEILELKGAGWSPDLPQCEAQVDAIGTIACAIDGTGTLSATSAPIPADVKPGTYAVLVCQPDCLLQQQPLDVAAVGPGLSATAQVTVANKVTVPDVRTLTYAQAVALAERQGLTVSPAPPDPTRLINAQVPPPGTRVFPNVAITVVYALPRAPSSAKGPSTRADLVTVPDLHGDTRDRALNILAGTGLAAELTGSTGGVVDSEQPPAGTRVARGSTVRLRLTPVATSAERTSDTTWLLALLAIPFLIGSAASAEWRRRRHGRIRQSVRARVTADAAETAVTEPTAKPPALTVRVRVGATTSTVHLEGS